MLMVIMLWIPKNNPINDKVAMDELGDAIGQ